MIHTAVHLISVQTSAYVEVNIASNFYPQIRWLTGYSTNIEPRPEKSVYVVSQQGID